MEKLHHIALPVKNIDEAVTWYRKNFDEYPTERKALIPYIL